jgi:hypothetical protein
MSLADIAMGKKVNQPAQTTQPQGGVLSQGAQGALPQQQGGAQGGYNGDISFNGKTMTVTNGKTQDKQGNVYIVANDGSIVTNAKNQQIAGHIQNGEFIPITQEYLDVLKQHGAVANVQQA